MSEDFNKFRSEYSSKIDKKTMEFQRKYGFELNPQKGHRTWDVEADAFKHAFLSADIALKYGDFVSLAVGVYHECETENNPYDEWNMDSWNNEQGRRIAGEIRKEYGNRFSKLSEKEQDAIIASKIMYKMRKGELITHPNDTRKFKNLLENVVYSQMKHIDKIRGSKGKSTGGAASVKPEGSKKSSGRSESDEDGHWITKNGNHILIEDSADFNYSFGFDPKGMAYSMGLVGKPDSQPLQQSQPQEQPRTCLDEFDSIVATDELGRPIIYFGTVSPEVLAIRNDPEMRRYLGLDKKDRR